jgi:diaminopimelate epimerase
LKMHVPFTKAHGSKNDFLLTPAEQAPPEEAWADFARAICDRHTGVGADGWLAVGPGDGECAGTIRLINSDGSDSEMSGNGTRCAGAYLLSQGLESRTFAIRTGAGPKSLTVLGKSGNEWLFEMNMGGAYYASAELRYSLPVDARSADVAILNVGNPQCVVFVPDFELDWRTIGKAIEWHPKFPQRTNVSFVREVDRHSIEVRFWERGAGETMSSGTGSTGAAFAALLRGVVESPVQVVTPAGPLKLRLDGNEMMLTGPAEITASGEFYWKEPE